MPSETAAPVKIKYSVSTDEIKAFPAEVSKPSAEEVNTFLKERLTTLAEHAGSFTAASGELVKCTGAITVTLPSAAANAVVEVLSNGHAVKVGAGAALIYGDFIEGVTPINLVGYQHVKLVSDGTNWFIEAGEPKREQEWSGFSAKTRAECHTGFVLNATRPVVLQVKLRSSESIWGARVEVNGKLAAWSLVGSGATSRVVTLSVPFVPAGATVKIDKDEPFGETLAAGVEPEISTVVL